MKLHYFSDLHLDHMDKHRDSKKVFHHMFRNLETDPSEDVLLIAGDTCEHRNLKNYQWFIDWCSEHFETTLIIFGNHDYYNTKNPKQYLEPFQKNLSENVIIGNNFKTQIGNCRILGSTLWSNISKKDSELVRNGVSDYRAIHGFEIADSNQYHNAAVNWLRTALNTPYDGSTIVLTHHLPSFESVSNLYKNSRLNAAFVTELSTLFEKASYWVHGHTHHNCRYVSNGCEVLCNPFGYVSERVENIHFEPNAFFEV